ncbi:hypothetical protein CPC08DRAFT_741302 [Agrocybe pediades]|nr:hypothetical protein CPC08DRAFT_741302 [Agrocybe pediades]
MPVPMRTAFHNKAEAKYNVTTEFPSLGLHAAAATGNVGLVKFALNNGQPVNSVLDGVLPLHAACAGGNLQVVKLLIDHGADVNAPRLPRKYSYDKNRDSSAPIIGSSGSTPLHFAAANGNTEVVRLLLLHGAHADRPDKHGITPEALAQQNGWVECATVLRDWIINKDRDLREREGITGNVQTSPSQSNLDISSSPSPRRRLHVKQSIDTALNMLKNTDSSTKVTNTNQSSTPPASPMKSFGEYTFYPNNSATLPPVESGSRRPSLPHVLDDVSRGRKFSTASSPATARSRRPRSVGTDGEDDTPDRQQEVIHPVYGRGGAARRLGSKYSLLSLFKKAHSGDGTGENAGSQGSSTSALPLSRTDSRGDQAGHNDIVEPSTSASTPSILSAVSRVASKVHRGSDASLKGRPTPPIPPQPTNALPLPRKSSSNFQTPPKHTVPLAIELHMALAQQQAHRNRSNSSSRPEDDGEKFKPSSPLARLNSKLLGGNRNRSASSGSMPIPDALPEESGTSFHGPNTDNDSGKPSPSPRPGILKAHNRTNSSGQGSPINARTLRFDSASNADPHAERKGSVRASPGSGPVALRPCNSAGSLSRLRNEGGGEDNISKRTTDVTLLAPTDGNAQQESQPDDGDLEEDNYGQPIGDGELQGTSNYPSILLQRQRGNSFASSESSLSPILSNDTADAPTMSVLNAEFPFSINRPPSFTEEPAEGIISSPDHLNVPILSDSRGRGDSLSSNSTADSRNHTLSGSSSSGPNVTVASPGMSDSYLLHSGHIDPTTIRKTDLSIDPEAANKPYNGSVVKPSSALSASRPAHSPIDIDFRSVSSHAQAEALVERARQEALEIANSQDASPPSGGLGRTPLSARLAAYGESLALERKLREQKENESLSKDRSPGQTTSNDFLPLHSPPRPRPRDGIERQLSLENKAGSPRRKRRPRDPRRPSTADGVSSSKPDTFFPGRTVSHQSSHSTSESSASPELLQATNVDQPSSAVNRIPTPQPSSSMLPLEGIRASTPIIPFSDDSLSRVDSNDAVDTETDSIPTSSTHKPAPAALSKREQVRSSAKKLTKMGIPVADQAAAASRAVPTIASAAPTKRFGLKSIMQTFKNKA